MNEKDLAKLREVKDVLDIARKLMGDFYESGESISDSEYVQIDEIWTSLTNSRLKLLRLVNK